MLRVIELAKKIPHLSNVNMDSSLSGKIKLLLEGDGEKKLAPPGKGDIPLNGLGIETPHAIITCKNGKYTIQRSGKAKTLLNGKQIRGPVELSHLDRLLFGTSQYYTFVIPSKARTNDPFITFEMMQDEIAQNRGIVTKETKSNMSKGI